MCCFQDHCVLSDEEGGAVSSVCDPDTSISHLCRGECAGPDSRALLLFFQNCPVDLRDSLPKSPLNKDLRLLMASRLAGPPPYGIVTPSATAYSPNLSSTIMVSSFSLWSSPLIEAP